MSERGFVANVVDRHNKRGVADSRRNHFVVNLFAGTIEEEQFHAIVRVRNLDRLDEDVDEMGHDVIFREIRAVVGQLLAYRGFAHLRRSDHHALRKK